MLVAFYAYGDSTGFYFNHSNELIDLPYPGSIFYAEVQLQCPEPNHLDIYLNPFSWPGEKGIHRRQGQYRICGQAGKTEGSRISYPRRRTVKEAIPQFPPHRRRTGNKVEAGL